jgi:hypothetical protein
MIANSYSMQQITEHSTIMYVVSMVIAIVWGWPFCAFLGLVYLIELIIRDKFLFTFWYLVKGTVISILFVIVIYI